MREISQMTPHFLFRVTKKRFFFNLAVKLSDISYISAIREIRISRTYQEIFELRIHNGGSRPGDEGSLFCFGIGRERTNSSPPTQPMGVHCQQVVFFLPVL